MKRLIILIIMIATALVAQGQNTLTLTGGSGHPGDTLTVSLSMTNSNAVSAMQTFVPLGDNLSYVPGSATLTSRSNGHQLTATVMDGSLRIYSYSLALASYTGNSGALLTFRVVLGREPGTVTLTPTQNVLSSASGTPLAVSAVSGSIIVQAPKVQVTPASIDYGHVPIRSSYTRTVTVKNIGNEPLTFSAVTFSDASLACSVPTTLAAGAQQNVTLTYSPQVAGATAMTATFRSNAKVGDSVVAIVADPYSVNELRPLSVNGYTDSVVTVELRLNNMDSIVGLQTSIKLPQALTYVDGSFATDATRTPGHIATAGLQGDTLTLLLTSLTGTPMHGADGVVGSFQLQLHGYGSYTLQLRNTALSDSAGNNVLSSVYSGTVYIYSPYLSCNSSMDFGSTPVTETATATLPLYNSGNAPLVIDQAVFTQEGWQLLNTLPLTMGTYGRDTLRVTYSGTAEGNHSAQMLLYTNDPRNDLKRINITAQRYEPNRLYLEGNADAAAATPEVDIMLDNYSSVTAIQMDVQYPHHDFTLEPTDILVTSRSNGHIVSAARLDDSTLRVLVLSMQNSPFNGNNGAVARIQLHALDSLSTESYPITLSNITSGCTDGIDRLTSIQNLGWFATRLVHDTTYIHDTSYVDVYVPVHDTTIIHDTSYIDVPYAVHDTTYIDVPYAVHDTTYIHDTSYVDVYVPVHDTTIIHDTSFVDVPYAVHDTTYIDVPYAVHDTTYIHDTSYVNVYVHDTAYITLLDTIYVNVPYPVHDTTVVIDTMTQYVPVHDTTVVTDTLWLTLHDTIWMTDTIYIHDTIYVPQEGVTVAETAVIRLYQRDGQIVVEGDVVGDVVLFDAVGRKLATRRGDGDIMLLDVPASGTYLVKVGNHPARKVVVIRQ